MGKINWDKPYGYIVPGANKITQGTVATPGRGYRERIFNMDGWELDEAGNVIEDVEWKAAHMDRDQIIASLKAIDPPINFNPTEKTAALREILMAHSRGDSEEKKVDKDQIISDLQRQIDELQAAMIKRDAEEEASRDEIIEQLEHLDPPVEWSPHTPTKRLAALLGREKAKRSEPGNTGDNP